MDHTPLVSAREALSWLGEPDVRFVDATWFMPNVPSSAHDAYEMEHIPGASYFDIDKISDASIDLPHMYPSLDKFEYCIGKLGISESDRVVVYDRSNFVASARAWWMFVSFGHEHVRVLDGGLSAWKKAGGSIEEGIPEINSKSYSGNPAGDAVIVREEVVAKLSNPSVSIVDARSAGRFNGTEPEPRPGLRGGHIPGSAHLYYGDVMDSDGLMKNPEQILSLLESISVDSDTQIVTTCGSGVTAAILLLAIYQVRQHDLRLYDGSWTEWALHPDSPL